MLVDAGHQARRLAPEEAFRISGGALKDWKDLRRDGVEEGALLNAAARSLPPATAYQILWVAGMTRPSTDGSCTRAGVCRDPDEEFMAEANEVWLQAWREDPGDPRTAYEAWLLRTRRQGRAGAREEDTRAGAPPGVLGGWSAREPTPGLPWGERRPPSDNRSLRLKRLAIEEEEEVARGHPQAKSRSAPPSGSAHRRTVVSSQPQIGGGHLQEERAAIRDGYIFGNLAQGTRNSYSTGWRQWTMFMKARDQSPFLTGYGREGRRQDEDTLLDWIVHLAHVQIRSEGTIKSKLFAGGGRRR